MAEPFSEVFGNADQAVVSADGKWIAASACWARHSRVAVYRAADLSLAHLLTFTEEAEPIAFHPALPLLAIGLDNGDEYFRAGGLTLLEADTGHRVDFTDPGRGIDLVRWLDPRTLELTFRAVDMHNEYVHHVCRPTVVRDDWRGLTPGALDLTALDGPLFDDVAYPDPGSARELLRSLAEQAGRPYS
ncbi:hypothetical protein [Streptomyces sp. NRRL B-24572]|uniref:hypothetical protein n=1 Tax=Streptomyces sp. NRRL B-24572 TaxID=1962156 RepID=UPI000A368F84|nr:hypothetical protein [Streptomyces sp. NRRL B-24572]